MRAIYFFIKLVCRPVNKITFISRQSNDLSLDFDLLIKAVQKLSPQIKIVVFTKMTGKNLVGIIRYTFSMFAQMKNIASSKVVVLDGYSAAVSVLNHRKNLKVVQMWHALGALKKFGFSVPGEEQGWDKAYLRTMNMHRNYDYILTTNEVSKPYFMEAFNANEEQMVIMGLPRIDFLLSAQAEIEIRRKFYRIYPQADNGKLNILYAPTHRADKNAPVNELIKAVNYDKFNLIIKLHGRNRAIETIYTRDAVLNEGGEAKFKGIELLHISDHIITDYSAIIFEASLMKKPVHLYAYDYEQYSESRRFYIDYENEMPANINRTIDAVMREIEDLPADMQRIENFIRKYIPYKDGKQAECLAKFIFNIILERVE